MSINFIYKNQYKKYENFYKSNLNLLESKQPLLSVIKNDYSYKNILPIENFKKFLLKNIYSDYSKFISTNFKRSLPGALIFNQWESLTNIKIKQWRPASKLITVMAINFAKVSLNKTSIYVYKKKLLSKQWLKKKKSYI